MNGAAFGGPDGTDVFHLHFDALQVHLDGPTIGKDQGGCAGRGVPFLERNRKKVKNGILVGPVDAAHPHRRHMLEMHAGQAPLGAFRFPVVPARLNRKPALLGQVDDIVHPQQRILQVSRDHGQIFRVERNESQEVHGSKPMLNFDV